MHLVANGRGKGCKRGRHSTGLVRHPSEPEPHFDSAERSGKHEIVEAAKMPNAKYFAGKLGEAGSERHVEIFKNNAPQAIRIMPSRHENSCEGARVLARILTDDFQAPGSDRHARRLGVTLVTAKYIGQPFFIEHLQSLL